MQGPVRARRRARTHGSAAWLCLVLLATGSTTSLADSTSVGVQPTRLAMLGVSGAAAHWVGFAYFDRAWYQGQRRDSIRWLRDWSGDTYVHMDKGGHFLGGMILSQSLSSAFAWTGFGPRASAGLGAATSFAVMFEIEMRDAYFADWGFSIPDFVANTAGASVPLIHTLWPETQAVGFKFSYWPSPLYLDYDERRVAGRPNTQYAIDDYEGMTFWLTFAVERVLPEAWQERWPDGFGLALGYGARGMHGANVKSRGREREYRNLPSAQPEVLLSVDYDARQLPGEGLWEDVKQQLNWMRFPAPAVRLYPDLRFYLLYL